jgi:catechol 2,3-dioxygenase-like lactoylglutathione lyase family enzyme
MNVKLEVVIIPVSDVDRAKAFYEKLGFRFDIDIVNENFRGIQFTPPDSEASLIFGEGVTSAKPGSADLVLAVDNVDAAREDLIARGVNVSEVFHYAGAPLQQHDRGRSDQGSGFTIDTERIRYPKVSDCGREESRN